MFTGIIQAKGAVESRTDRRISLRAPRDSWPDAIQLGESIAVNGCCLTVAADDGALHFDLSEETVVRTTFGSMIAGTRVNLERALRAGDRLGGHFVQGHVDGLGELVGRTAYEGWERFQFRVPDDGAPYLIDKGSIALNGVSLTVVAPEGPRFEVALIPYTLRETDLGELEVGDKVHVEYDVLAKHVARLLERP